MLFVYSVQIQAENRHLNNTTKIDHTEHRAQLASAGQDSLATDQTNLSIPDVLLVNEKGEKIAIRENLFKNKIVVINTIYTTCTSVCPIMGIQFSQLQALLKQRPDTLKDTQDIILISISIDPLNDTPQRLQSWKNKFNGGPGWTLLTGSQSNIDRLLKATGLFAPDPQEHTPVTLVGSLQNNQWTRLSGLGPAEQIAQLVDKLLATIHTPALSSAELNDG